MAEELLERIPPEKRWAITAKILSSLHVMRGEKLIVPELGKGEGIISPIWGAEKWTEIHVKIYRDAAKLMFPMFKEMFNIPVKDAIGAAKLNNSVGSLLMGPEFTYEFIEETRERIVGRVTKCTWMERFKELEVDPAFITCDKGPCQLWCEEGLKAVNPKITYKATTFMPRGDPYCEGIFEFKDE